MFDVERASLELVVAHLSGGRFAGFDADEPIDEEQAYATQDRFLTHLVDLERDRFAGFKIGSTTAVMQRYLGIANPCAGRLTARRLVGTNAVFSARDRGRLGVECELAVRIGTDIPAHAQPFDADTIVPYIASCFAAIEVVEDRYDDWRSLSASTLIADNFFHYAVVLGDEHHAFDPTLLKTASAHMIIDGETVGSGIGSDVLGDPLAGLAWIANNTLSRGASLRRNDVVLLGSLVETHWVERGSVVEIVNEPLGRVRVQFV